MGIRNKGTTRAASIWRELKRAISLCLCLCVFFPHVEALALDYSTGGLGSKHSDDGFTGFGGFGDQVGTARDNATDRAGNAEKAGNGYKSQADELKGMGERVGQDRSKLAPLVSQARAQDQQNSSGSSRLQKLFSTPYPANPESKYALALRALGPLKINDYRSLYENGDKAKQALLRKSEELNEQANKSFSQAAQGLQAAKQLNAFRQTAVARNAAMGSVKQIGSAQNPASGISKSGQRLTGNFGNERAGLLGSGGSKLNSLSSITSSKEEMLEGGTALRHSGKESFDGAGGTRSPASVSATGKAPGSAHGAKMKDTTDTSANAVGDFIARLDALPNRVKRSADPILPKGFSLGGGIIPTNSDTPIAPAISSNDSLQTLNAVLQIKENEPAQAATPELKEAALEPKESLGSGFFLEEDSLFLRVKNSLVKAEKSGRLARP